MTDPRRYRELAVEAAAIAAKANTDALKLQLLNISRTWEMLAIEAERAEELSVQDDPELKTA